MLKVFDWSLINNYWPTNYKGRPPYFQKSGLRYVSCSWLLDWSGWVCPKKISFIQPHSLAKDTFLWTVVSILDTEKMFKSRKWKKQQKMYPLSKSSFVWFIEQISIQTNLINRRVQKTWIYRVQNENINFY